MGWLFVGKNNKKKQEQQHQSESSSMVFCYTVTVSLFDLRDSNDLERVVAILCMHLSCFKKHREKTETYR